MIAGFTHGHIQPFVISTNKLSNATLMWSFDFFSFLFSDGPPLVNTI